jgi:glycosyltransferase involved in cell wall biosynthesis
MRLLYVCENYWPMIGGAERANQEICQGMAARGHEVTVVTHQPGDAPARELVGGVAVVRVPCNGSRYVFTLAALPAILKHAPAADVVHTVTFNGAPPSWLAARLTGKPVLLTVWETWIGQWARLTTFSRTKAAVHEFLERVVFLPTYDRYIAISRSTERRLAGAFPRRLNRIGCIYLGFDPSPWKRPSNREQVRAQLGLRGAFVVVGYGRPGVSKGFQFLVDAAPEIAALIPNAELLLVLSEARQHRNDLADLKSRAAPNVRFLPSQPFERLVEIVTSADCIVVPSLAEGFGYTALEAAASGVPFVASNTSSIPEVVGGKYVFSEPGSVESIARAVKDVEQGRYNVLPEKSFSWRSTVDAYELEYERLIKERAWRRPGSAQVS